MVLVQIAEVVVHGYVAPLIWSNVESLYTVTMTVAREPS